MGKCNNSDGLIDELIYGLYDIDPDGNLDDVQYLEECKRYLDKKLKEIFENYELNDALYDNIETALIESGINTNDTYFSKENIKRKLEGFNSGVIEEIGVDTSSKLLEIPTTTMEVYNSDFLTDSYGYATDVRLNAEKLFRNLVANYTLIDRENGRVINSATLNSSIRALQQKLFDNIIDYINLIRKRGINTDFENLLKELEDSTTKRIELYKNGEYTHVLEKLRNLIDSQLTMSSDDLIQSNSKMLIGNIRDKAKILAYNSRVLLYNFDSYLKLLYGKNIVIKDTIDRLPELLNVSVTEEEIRDTVSIISKNTIQEKIISLITTKYFEDTTAIKRLSAAQYAKVLLCCKKFLEAHKFVLLTQILTSKCEKNRERVGITGVKIKQKIEESKKYKVLFAKKYNAFKDLIDKQLSSLIASIYSSEFKDSNNNDLFDPSRKLGNIADELVELVYLT